VTTWLRFAKFELKHGTAAQVSHAVVPHFSPSTPPSDAMVPHVRAAPRASGHHVPMTQAGGE
jgi:hypothetical protein